MSESDLRPVSREKKTHPGTPHDIQGVLRSLEWMDERMLRTWPSLRRYCGEALIVGHKAPGAG